MGDWRRDDLILSIRNLFRNFRRTIAILLTVGLGAGALFAFQGFIHGVLGNYRENMIHAHYGNGQLNKRDTAIPSMKSLGITGLPIGRA